MFKFLEAALLLAGMTIGVGMFAIPYAFATSGFWLGAAELVLLAGVALVMNLLYTEIVLGTAGAHRMPGYVRMYLGRGAAAVSWASTLFGAYGALLAYLIAGSIFLANIFGGDVSSWALVLAASVGILTFFPLKEEARINGVVTVFEIASIALLALYLLPRVNPAHLAGTHVENLFVPYGILLFALSGASVVPDAAAVAGRGAKRRARAAIIAGSLAPPALYFLFAYAVTGVTGSATSIEAIGGLAAAYGRPVVLWGSIAGFLAVFTSYVALSGNVQALLRFDWGVPRRAAWIAASAAPLFLYLAGFQNFIAIISTVGVVAFGTDAILFFMMGRAVRRQKGISSFRMSLAAGAVCLVILAGVLWEIGQYLR